MSSRPAPRGKKHMFMWVALACVAIVAVVLLPDWRKDVPADRPMAETLPPLEAQAPAAPETDEPVQEPPAEPAGMETEEPELAAQPEPEPIVEAVVEPLRPEDIDLGEVSANPDDWPSVVTLVKARDFPAMFNGKVVGSIRVPAGAPLKLAQVTPTVLRIEYKGVQHTIPESSTDLRQRIVAARQQTGGEQVAETSSVAQPTPTPRKVASIGPVPAQPEKGVAGFLGKRPPNLRVEIKRGKRTRKDGTDYDNRTERLSFEVKVTNLEMREVTDLEGRLVVVGRSTTNRRLYKVLTNETFNFDLESRGEFKHEARSVQYQFDDNFTAKHGYKYGGYLVVIRDKTGKAISTTGSGTLRADPSKAEEFSEGTIFDKSLKPMNVGAVPQIAN